MRKFLLGGIVRIALLGRPWLKDRDGLESVPTEPIFQLPFCHLVQRLDKFA